MFWRKRYETQAREFARERASWAAERGVLLDRIMHLADRPWAVPPVQDRDERNPPDPYEYFSRPDMEVIEPELV